jgi:Helix-turn-helix domain
VAGGEYAVEDETPGGLNTRGSEDEAPSPTASESNTRLHRTKGGNGFVAFDRQASHLIRAKLKSPVQRDILTELMLRVDHVTHDLPVSFAQLAQYCRITRQRLSRNLPHMEEEGILEIHRGTNDDDISVFTVLCYAALSPVAGNKTLQPPLHGGTRGGTRGGNKVIPLNTERPAKTPYKKYKKEEEVDRHRKDPKLEQIYAWATERGLDPTLSLEEVQELQREEAAKG